MAAGMNDIKSRMKSVGSTMQITKAMELVATSKLRRAKERAEGSRAYLETLETVVRDVLASSEAAASPYLKTPKNGKTLLVVIAGDRGLAGGYNANIFRAANSLVKEGECEILPIGKKACEYYEKRGTPLFGETALSAQNLGTGGAMKLGQSIADAYLTGEYANVTLLYTKFVSVMTQSVVAEEIFPLPKLSGGDEPLFDGDAEEILASVVPNYLGGILSSAVAESVASETGARRTAMNAANKNAEEMLSGLMLRYNRVRQALITQEITEIVSGAEAL